MMTETTLKQPHSVKRKNKEEGFTLVEVIAVLVILGILAAVAVPKFFDMQDTAREKAMTGAVGELNGQIALAFAQNALQGGPSGGYNGLPTDSNNWANILGPDFLINITVDTNDGEPLNSGTIELVTDEAATHVWTLNWTSGNNSGPGWFTLGNKQ